MVHLSKNLYTVNPLFTQNSRLYQTSMWELHGAYLILRQICERIALEVAVELNINLSFKACGAEHIYMKLTCDLYNWV